VFAGGASPTAFKDASANDPPTVTKILRQYRAHPQLGFERAFADEERYTIPVGGRVGIRCWAQESVDVSGGLDIGRDLPTVRVDAYVSVTAGVTVAPETPVKHYSLQVDRVGAATAHDVVLEVGNDGVNFTEILRHSSVAVGEWPATPDGQTAFSGPMEFPAMFYRSRLASWTNGGGGSVVVTIVGMP
jgi:hypothetical protein